MANTVRGSLHEIVFGSDTFAGQAFDVLLFLCIAASVSFTMLESVHAYRVPHATFFWDAERMFTGLFTAEYALRVCVAQPGPRTYVCSFFGAVDLIATLPSLLEAMFGFGASSRGIRFELVLRLLRVFRVLQWAGLNEEAEALKAALYAARRKVAVFLIFIMVLVTFMGTVAYVVEDPRSGFTSIPRSIYWAIVTLTTVGYGDISPQTVTGQALASVMMVCGYSLLAVPTSLAAAEYSLSSGLQLPPAGYRGAGGGGGGGRSSGGLGGGRKRGSSETILPIRVCATCDEAGHEVDAVFCRICGSALSPLGDGQDGV